MSAAIPFILGSFLSVRLMTCENSSNRLVKNCLSSASRWSGNSYISLQFVISFSSLY